MLGREHIPFATGNWSALRSLRSLACRRSLCVVLYELHMSADDPSCRSLPRQRCGSFIEHPRQKIFAISWNQKPECSVENDGCGLITWREQRYRASTQTLWSCRKQRPCVFLHQVWQLMIYFWIKNTALNLSLLNAEEANIIWNQLERIFFYAEDGHSTLYEIFIKYLQPSLPPMKNRRT